MGKKKHPYSMHIERMIREGRYDAYKEWCKSERDKGRPAHEVGIEARKVFGYLGPKEEQRLYDIFMGNTPDGEPLTVLDAMKGLPPTATAQDEFDWVRSHPIMTELAFGGEVKEIGPADILSAPHGCAPSRGAVNLLGYLMKNPKELYSPMVKEYQRRISKVSEGETDEEDILPPDPTIEELIKYAELGD